MKYIVVILILSMFGLGCTTTKDLPNQASLQGIDLNGLWVGHDKNDIQFVLYVEETDSSLGLNLMGKLVIPMEYKKQGDQALIKFRNTAGEEFQLLAQVNDENKMRMSITTEEVRDFMPVGQLGEKVYKLSKVEDTELMTARLHLAMQSVSIR